MPAGGGFAFGPYQLDTRANRLFRGDDPVELSPRQVALLRALLTADGKVVTKDRLIEIVWEGVAVGDSSLAKLAGELRQRLSPDDTDRYIRTVARLGYQFVAPVSPIQPARAKVDLLDLLAPDRAWSDGLAALESLERHQLAQARAILEQLVAANPDEAKFRVGLAFACALQFEGTRADSTPDRDALALAMEQAREACQLNHDLPAAWAALGLVLLRAGDRANGVAALYRAVRLGGTNWLCYFWLAEATWGEERLSAARQVLAQNPGFPMACWLAASPWVARGVLDHAERELDGGLSAMDVHAQAPGRFQTVAFYYLKGLLAYRRGAVDESLSWFDRELALEDFGHVYARECSANTLAAKGSVFLITGDTTAAHTAFAASLQRIPDQPVAHAGMAILDASGDAMRLRQAARHLLADRCPANMPVTVDIAVARAILLVAAGDHAAGDALVAAALDVAPPGNAGWLVPLLPLLRVQEHRDAWTGVLGTLARRAR